MFLLVPAHPGCPGQIPQSRKTVVCVCAINALKLLVGWQEWHPACKNWVVRYWRGYLSEARCKWFAYGPADATATHHLLLHKNPEWFTFLVLAYPGCPGKRQLNGRAVVVVFMWNSLTERSCSKPSTSRSVLNCCKTSNNWWQFHYQQQFLRATQHICYSAYMPWQFHLSVRPSATWVDQSKAFEVRIMQFSPYSSPIPLVSKG